MSHLNLPAADVAIGLDTGRSATKIVVKIKTPNGEIKTLPQITYPTFVTAAIYIDNEQTAERAKAETVDLDGKSYFVGRTAMRQGSAEKFSGQSDDWIQTDDHDVLVKHGFELAMKMVIESGHRPNLVVAAIGLPASLQNQKSDLRARIKSVMNKSAPNYGVQALKTTTASQASAPLLQIALDDKGQETGRADTEESWGVVEIGHFTTDFCLQISGDEIQMSSESTRGVTDLYNAVATELKRGKYYAGDVVAIEEAIQKRTARINGSRVDIDHLVAPIIDSFAKSLCNTINSRFGARLAGLDGLIVTGGGALIVGDWVKKQYPVASTPADPRYSVSDGLARFAIAAIRLF
jgi:plasmid segregation protein ParM